jgi:hypothetical protein
VPAADAPYPLVILGATLDPATPFQNAERIAAGRTADTWLIYKPGGPHVIFGRGEACPDDLVTDILLFGHFPRERTSVCPGDVANDYVAVTPHAIAAEPSTLAALSAIEAEIVGGVDYQYWDGEDALVYGCPFGGTIAYNPVGKGANLALKGCAFTADAAASGTGLINDNTGGFQLQLRFTGSATGKVTYRRLPNGKPSVEGRLTIEAPVAP